MAIKIYNLTYLFLMFLHLQLCTQFSLKIIHLWVSYNIDML